MCNNLKSQLLDWPRERIIRSLETLQDFIAILLCVGLFTAMFIEFELLSIITSIFS